MNLAVPMVWMPQGAEWLIILAIVILLFGAAKLPDLARGSGRALRIFKAETKGLTDDDEASSNANTDEKPGLPAGEQPASAQDEATQRHHHDA